MVTELKLDILTPEGPKFENLAVPGVELSALLGEMGVLPNHEAFVTAVRPGLLRFKDGSEDVRLAVGSGFFEIRAQGEAVVLVDRATPLLALAARAE